MKEMTWLSLLGCMTAWGAAAVLMKVTAGGIGPVSSVVGNTLGYLLIGAFLLPRAQLSLNWTTAAAVLTGLLFPIGNFFFYKLTQTGEVSRFAPVTALYVIVPILCGVWLFGESMSSRRVIGVVLALAALWLLNSD
jgi:drug/metabolite transporter (DMT)-like permease